MTELAVTDTAEPMGQAPVARATIRLGPVGGALASPPVEATWGIAVERPIAITINGTPWTVLLATPADVEDLALGLALTERVVTAAAAVQRITVESYLQDISIDLSIPADRLTSSAIRSRSLAGNSACGLCGLESLADVHRVADARALARNDLSGLDASTQATVPDTAVLRAFAMLPSQQPINRESHSVHAAAWCMPDGTIALVREDVGRHNALDKLIGGMARQRLLADAGFIVMSSRCSYELVYKAAATNATLLATISAPTSMALEWSRALSLPVVCRVGGPEGGRVVHFDAGVADAR